MTRNLGRVVLAGLLLPACGGGSTATTAPSTSNTTATTAPAATTASPSPVPTAAPSTLAPGVAATTITITEAGVSPADVIVSPGTRVTFVNRDQLAHDMTSDPHPSHTTCPPINDVGLLQPGQSGQTAPMTTVRVCGFHDHGQPSNPRLSGSITVR